MTRDPRNSAAHLRLDRLSGVWDTVITPAEPGGPEGTATDNYHWIWGGHFLMHEVDAVIGGQRLCSLEVFAVAGDGSYVSRSYDADGTINDFTAALDDDGLRITGARQRFAGQFGDGGRSLSGEWEALTAGGDWAPLMRVALRKRA